MSRASSTTPRARWRRATRARARCARRCSRRSTSVHCAPRALPTCAPSPRAARRAQPHRPTPSSPVSPRPRRACHAPAARLAASLYPLLAWPILQVHPALNTTIHQLFVTLCQVDEAVRAALRRPFAPRRPPASPGRALHQTPLMPPSESAPRATSATPRPSRSRPSAEHGPAARPSARAPREPRPRHLAPGAAGRRPAPAPRARRGGRRGAGRRRLRFRVRAAG